MASQDWEKYLGFRCTGCGNCCRDTVVCVTDSDVRRIVDGTGRAAREFVRFYRHDEIAMSENDPLWVKFKDHKAVMALRSVHDRDRKSTRLNSSHSQISYAVFCLKKKK